MDIILIAGLCIVCTIICKVLEKDNREIKILIVLGCVLMIFTKISGELELILSEIISISQIADIDSQYIKILFKGCGICCITQFASDYCKDCGENALSSQVMFCGKIALLVTALPLFEAIMNIVKALLEI